MDTTQLKALRDAAARMPASVLKEACDIAIASLEAAEQPEPCATIPLPESASELPRCSCGFTGWPTPSCSGCGKPLSAEAHQPPAEQAQQPARTHCTCAFDDVPGEYPCAVHGEEPTIPLAQHEAIVAAVQGQVAQARREGLREAEELVRRDAKAAVGKPGPEWATLTIAADGIRALAEKSGEGGK